MPLLEHPHPKANSVGSREVLHLPHRLSRKVSLVCCKSSSRTIDKCFVKKFDGDEQQAAQHWPNGTARGKLNIAEGRDQFLVLDRTDDYWSQSRSALSRACSIAYIWRATHFSFTRLLCSAQHCCWTSKQRPKCSAPRVIEGRRPRGSAGRGSCQPCNFSETTA